MLFHRLAVAFALSVMLVTAAFVGCSAIDPVPPHPHGDSGEEPDPLSKVSDGGGVADGGEEAGP